MPVQGKSRTKNTVGRCSTKCTDVNSGKMEKAMNIGIAMVKGKDGKERSVASMVPPWCLLTGVVG